MKECASIMQILAKGTRIAQWHCYLQMFLLFRYILMVIAEVSSASMLCLQMERGWSLHARLRIAGDFQA